MILILSFLHHFGIQDLPNVFHDLRIVLPKSSENFKKLKRYVLAFDGDVLHEFDSSSATHIIMSSSDPPPRSKVGGLLGEQFTCIEFMWMYGIMEILKVNVYLPYDIWQIIKLKILLM